LMSGTTLSLFLIDAEIATKATGLIFAQLLGLSINLGLGVPTISILNKIDLIRDKLVDVEQMLTNTELVRKRIIEESRGVVIDLALGISGVLPGLLPAARTAKVSAKTGEGMAELYDIIHEVFCACGDLT
ncbi:MAG: ATP/GTP-binding protein, partial [Hadesarchaea archaeon]|nr:ATP/GTP-binding protein [Hadesarchaea archaeon]